MITIIYLKLFASAVLGQIAQILVKADSVSKIAEKSSVDYSLKWFLSLDWKPIIKAFLGIAVFFLFFGDIANPKHLANQETPFNIVGMFTIPIYLIWNSAWIAIAFVFGGCGSYMAFKFQSEATKRAMNGIKNVEV